MPGPISGLIERRTLKRWDRALGEAEGLDAIDLKQLRNRARSLGRRLDKVLQVTETKLANAVGASWLRPAEDEAILDAQRKIWDVLRLWVEPAGATALAALLSGEYEPAPDEKLAVLICGANPAPGPYD